MQERGAGDPVRYALRAQIDPKHEAPTVPSEATTAKTMPARSQMPSIGYLPLALKFVSNWLPWCRFPTTWQAIHVPELVLEEWRGAARKASASVSTFDLIAAWVHTVCPLEVVEEALLCINLRMADQMLLTAFDRAWASSLPKEASQAKRGH